MSNTNEPPITPPDDEKPKSGDDSSGTRPPLTIEQRLIASGAELRELTLAELAIMRKQLEMLKRELKTLQKRLEEVETAPHFVAPAATPLPAAPQREINRPPAQKDNQWLDVVGAFLIFMALALFIIWAGGCAETAKPVDDPFGLNKRSSSYQIPATVRTQPTGDV